MQVYRDIDGDSSVAAYEIGADFIRVVFTTGAMYLYTYASAGRQSIETMKQLAASGNGLNAYINRRVREAYERRER
jgi:hypothetical protein